MKNNIAPRHVDILLVEDSPSDAALLQERMMPAGDADITVAVARSLGEAGKLLAARHFDIILLDLTLPDGIGLDTVRWARQTAPDMAVVVLTGIGEEKTGMEAVRMGVQDYLVKSQVNSLTIQRSIRYSIERKRFEEAVSLSEEKFSKMFRGGASAMALTELEGGVIIDVNDRWLELLGRSRDEVIGRSIEKLDLWSNIADRSRMIADLRRDGAVRDREIILLRRDGSLWTALMSAQVIAVGGRQVMLSSAVDITRRKQAEEALVRERANLQAIFNAINVGMLLVDEHGVLRQVNDVIARWVGNGVVSSDDMQPGDFLHCIHALNTTGGCGHSEHCPTCPIRNSFETALREGHSVHGVEAQTTLSLGSGQATLWFDISADPITIDGEPHVILALNDITARKETQAALERSNAQLDILAEVAGRLLASDSPQTVVEALCKRVMEFLDCHVFVNYLLDEKAGRLHMNACAGIGEKEAAAIEWLDLGVAICGCVARDGKRIVAEDIQESCDPRADLVRSYGIKAYACHPLMVAGKVLGTLSFGTRSRTTFSDDDLDLMKAVADQVSIAMGRKRTEDALMASQDMLAVALKQLTLHMANSPLAVIEWGPDMRLTMWNDQAQRIFGWQADEVIGKRMDEFRWVYNQDDKIVAQVSEGLRSGREPASFSANRNYRKDGTVIDCEWYNSSIVDESGNLVSILSLVQDVTQRNQSQEQLRRLNRTLQAHRDSTQALLRATDESQYLQTVCDIIVKDCGAAMVWIGYSQDDEAKSVVPVAFAGFEDGYLQTLRVTWADTERGRGPTGMAIRTGREAICANMLEDPRFAPWREHAMKRGYASSIALPLTADGRTFGALTMYSNEPDPFSEDEVRLLRDLAGDLSYGIATIRLRIAHQQAEEAIRRQAEELEVRVQERTAELGQAVSELRSEVGLRRAAEKALMDQASQLRALASELTLAEQRERRRLAQVLHDHLQQFLVAAKLRVAMLKRDKSGSVREAAAELDDLIGQSIDASRTLTSELSPPILHEGGLVPGLQWLARWMEAKHGLRVAFESEEEAIELDDDVMVLLFQAVRELLFNVVKHSGAGEASVRVSMESGRVRLTISDKGVGFEPLRLVPGQGGFGLFSIRERLQMIGGSLAVDSSPGHGSTFVLMSPPLVQAGGAEAQKHRLEPVAGLMRAPRAKTSADTTIKVLLVDDHAIMREGIRGLLDWEGDMEVVGEASDGETALVMVRKLRPDVVLMDINMAGMSGVEATRVIHEEFPDIIVIGLSMFEEPERAEEMRKAGAAHYLSKSGEPETLVAAVRLYARRK